ncbi:Villin [Entamoeba marina]
MADIKEKMRLLREKKGLEDKDINKTKSLREATKPSYKAVDAENDVQKRLERRRQREIEKEEEKKKVKTGGNEEQKKEIDDAESIREARRLERQKRREEEKRRMEEEERERAREREERKKKREEERRIKEEQAEMERQKLREERKKQRELERKALQPDYDNLKEIEIQAKLQKGKLVETKEVNQPEKVGEGEEKEKKPEEEVMLTGKVRTELIELRTANASLQKQIDELNRINEQHMKGANIRQIELENTIKKNNEEIGVLKSDLELYRGKQKEKPLFHTRPARDLEWPDELKMPAVKVGVKALGITSSNEACIGEITEEDGNKWGLCGYNVLKHKVYPAPEIMQETIDGLVLLVNNYKIRQNELEKTHKETVDGMSDEMRQLRQDYEKLRDVYGADVVKMHSNINNRAAMAYGLECEMSVQVAEAIKDVKDYTKGRSRWYSTTSKNDEKLWADLRNENNGQINYPKGRHDFKARLFQFYTSEDNELLCNELRSYKQDDLLHGKAFILDTFNEVFVYYATNCPPQDKAKVTSAALAYNKYSDDGRSINTPVVQVEDGQEPVRFRLQFKTWNAKRVDKDIVNSTYLDNDKFFDYSKLLRQKDLPAWVDRSCLEEYLRDDDFKGVFKMERSEFNLLPRWRKDAERRKAKLF